MLTDLERHDNESESEVNVKRLRGRSVMYKLRKSGPRQFCRCKHSIYLLTYICNHVCNPVYLALYVYFANHSVILAS